MSHDFVSSANRFFRGGIFQTDSCPMGKEGCGMSQRRLDSFAQGFFLAVFGAGVLLAAWLLFQEASKNSVIQTFSTAAQQGNAFMIRNNTDWDSVRSWLKEDLKNRPGMGGVESGKKVDSMVDALVQPDVVDMMIAAYQSKAGHINPADFVRQTRFSGLMEMTMTIAPPPQMGQPWLNTLEPVRLIFSLDGFSWKLKRVEAPDYLLPPELILNSAND